MNVRRTIRGPHPGPTVAQLRELTEDVPDDARVTIDYDKGYNQFDPGGWTMSVTVTS